MPNGCQMAAISTAVGVTLGTRFLRNARACDLTHCRRANGWHGSGKAIAPLQRFPRTTRVTQRPLLGRCAGLARTSNAPTYAGILGESTGSLDMPRWVGGLCGSSAFVRCNAAGAQNAPVGMENPMSAISAGLTRRSLFVGDYAPIKVTIDPMSGLTVDDFDFVVPDGALPAVSYPSLGARDSRRPSRPRSCWSARSPASTSCRSSSGRRRRSSTSSSPHHDSVERPARWPGRVVQRVAAGASRRVGVGWRAHRPTERRDDPCTRHAPGRGLVRRYLQPAVHDERNRHAGDPRPLDERIDERRDRRRTNSQRALEFYQEVSYGNLDLSASVFGPVQLSGNFDYSPFQR